MNDIDRERLDEVLARTFKELTSAIDKYHIQSIQVYSGALLSLVQLRAHLADRDDAQGTVAGGGEKGGS